MLDGYFHNLYVQLMCISIVHLIAMDIDRYVEWEREENHRVSIRSYSLVNDKSTEQNEIEKRNQFLLYYFEKMLVKTIMFEFGQF